MTDLRGTLDRIVAPPTSPGFHDELAARIQVRQRTAIKRRRSVSAVLAMVVIAAASAAAVFAFGRGGQVIDKTFSCPPGNDNTIAVGGHVKAHYSYASVEVRPAIVLQAFVSAQTGKGSIVWPPQYAGCQQVSRALPLKPSGLPAVPVGTDSGGYRGASAYCYLPVMILFRARIAVDASGRPTQVAFALWKAKRRVPIAFFDLRPPRVKAYAAKFCQPG